MPKVNFVKSARKENPVAQVGESYYWWKNRHGPKKFSKTYPRASQLTGSDKLARAYGAQESVEDAFQRFNNDHDQEALVEAINDAAEQVREVAEEYQESCDNIREAFSESSTADECEEKAEALNSYADELEQMASDVENFDKPEEVDMDDFTFDEEEEGGSGLDEEAYDDAVNQYNEDFDNWVNDISSCDGQADLQL